MELSRVIYGQKAIQFTNLQLKLKFYFLINEYEIKEDEPIFKANFQIVFLQKSLKINELNAFPIVRCVRSVRMVRTVRLVRSVIMVRTVRLVRSVRSVGSVGSERSILLDRTVRPDRSLRLIRSQDSKYCRSVSLVRPVRRVSWVRLIRTFSWVKSVRLVRSVRLVSTGGVLRPALSTVVSCKVDFVQKSGRLIELRSIYQ